MVPSTKSVRVFKRNLTQEERSVRGMLVTGLTKRDMAALDTFEGTGFASSLLPAMLLPVEFIDCILSFLRGDHLALDACSGSHPLLFQLAEPYFYTDMTIIVTDDNFAVSSFHENISKNPHILDYLRTLEIRAHSHIVSPPLLTQDSRLLSIISMIPRMTKLVSLILGDTLFGSSVYNGNEFFPTFRSSLQHSSLQHLSLVNFHNFPLSVLDNAKNIDKLTLTYCLGIMEPISKSPYQMLETLVIRSNPDEDLLIGMTTRVANLKSLQLRGLLTIRYDWNGFPELLAACSSSLTELHIDVGNLGPGHWIGDLEFPFTLSRHKSLKHLSISALVFSSKFETERRTHFALPAITRLIKTTPSIRDIILRLHWMDSDIISFGRLDWSPLVQLHSDFSGICPRIHLRISVNSRGPDTILDALAENDALMGLVKRDVVILKSLAEGPNFL